MSKKYFINFLLYGWPIFVIAAWGITTLEGIAKDIHAIAVKVNQTEVSTTKPLTIKPLIEVGGHKK